MSHLLAQLVLERVAQTPLALGSMYGMNDSVNHGSKHNSNERSQDENSASAKNSFQRFLSSYLDRGATVDGVTKEKIGPR